MKIFLKIKKMMNNLPETTRMHRNLPTMAKRPQHTRRANRGSTQAAQKQQCFSLPAVVRRLFEQKKTGTHAHSELKRGHANNKRNGNEDIQNANADKEQTIEHKHAEIEEVQIHRPNPPSTSQRSQGQFASLVGVPPFLCRGQVGQDCVPGGRFITGHQVFSEKSS